ncbi:LOW QUALITY PROTEIN: hypothetical protein V2J09_016071 [Rumex salicifolius]
MEEGKACLMKKPSVLKSWSRHNLTPHIWLNILSRLPVKSVLRFRCVSNSWQSIIDDPTFAAYILITSRTTSMKPISSLSLKKEKIDCILKSCKNYRITATLNSLDTANLGNR